MAKTQEDERVRLIHHERTQGIPSSLQEALWSVDADFFSLIGGDDVWLPPLLDEQVKCLEAQPGAYAVACDGWIIDAAGSRDGRRISDLFQPVREDEWGTAAALLRRPHISSIGIVCAYGALREVGFSLALPFLFDWLAWIRLANKTPIARNDKVLCEFRVHDRNSSLGHRRLDGELPTFADLLASSGIFSDRESKHWIAYHRLRGWQHLRDKKKAWLELMRMMAIRPFDHKNATQLSQLLLGEAFNRRIGSFLGPDAVSHLQ